MFREAISTRTTRKGGLNARSGDGLATPISRAWRTALASQGLGLSPDQAVGLDQPELKPLEKAVAFDEGGSPTL